MLYDTISRRAGVFLQLSSGLSTNGALEVIKVFPKLFLKHFVYCKEELITAEKFFNDVLLPAELEPEEERTLAMFRTYIESCSSTGQL